MGKEMKRVEESIRELGELQLEGADTYLSAFAQLKSYPFSVRQHTGFIHSTASILTL